ncbi:MAG TPA: sodium:solute symporter family protein [Treponemataceae bacterium]|nr:sodium:solute symporter family protein [Treponemataceae bacterium]
MAGRKIHPVVMALSYGATFISTSAIIGFGGAAAVYGMGVIWLTFMNIFVGIFLAFVFFGRRTRKMGHNLDAHTFPELLAKRYDSRFLQLGGGILIFVAMPLYAGSVIIGGVQFVSQTLKINYEVALLFFVAVVALYVVMGGLKGVMYADAFQGSLMFLGMLFLLIFTYVELGGVRAAHQALTDMAPVAKSVFGANGHEGWTAMPKLFSPCWWQLVSTIVLGVGVGVLAQPQLTVRFMTVKSGHELNRAVLIGGVFIAVMTGVAFTVGALCNVYFMRTVGKIALIAGDKKTDSIIPLFIDQALPSWFIILFFVTLLSAAMSTLSSQFHTMGTAIGRDVLEKGLKLKSRNAVAVNRIAMGFGILLSTLIAYFLPLFYAGGTAIIATGTAIFFGLCASAFLPSYVGALYSKRVSRAAAVSCFISGVTVTLFWLLFVHAKESAPLGLCNLLFGKPALFPALQHVDPIIAALPLSTLVYMVVNKVSKPVSEEITEKAFSGVVSA